MTSIGKGLSSPADFQCEDRSESPSSAACSIWSIDHIRRRLAVDLQDFIVFLDSGGRAPLPRLDACNRGFIVVVIERDAQPRGFAFHVIRNRGLAIHTSVPGIPSPACASRYMS